MHNVGWASLKRLIQGVGLRAGWSRRRPPMRRKATPDLESLESLSLLSAGGPTIGAAALHFSGPRGHQLAATHSGARRPQAFGSPVDSNPETSPTQTTSLTVTLTNFQNMPLMPPVNLFDPTLGTLRSVRVTDSASQSVTLTVQNLNLTTPASVPASLSGGFQINGLSQPIVQPAQSVSDAPVTLAPLGQTGDTYTFPPLQLKQSTSTTLTDPSSLAFYTASSGRTTITPTMTASATASSGTVSNVLRTTQAATSATVTVTYTYLPACPTAGNVGVVGVHHQPTQLVLPLQGPVNPTLAGTPGNYHVTTTTGRRIRIISAKYNPATHSVTLRPAEHLNVHDRFRLTAMLPCPSGDSDVVTIPFGTKDSLIGFHDHRGDYIAVSGGRIVRSRARSRAGDHPGRGRSAPAGLARGPRPPGRPAGEPGRKI